jgi:hypothetical protein
MASSREFTAVVKRNFRLIVTRNSIELYGVLFPHIDGRNEVLQYRLLVPMSFRVSHFSVTGANS